MSAERRRPQPIPPKWKEYHAWTGAHLRTARQAVETGVWPEETPQSVIDVFAKSPAGERRDWELTSVYPSFDKVLTRSQEEVKALRDIERARHRWVQEHVERDPRGLHQKVHDALSSLSERESDVLIQRFGLEDGRSRSNREIAQNIGRSPRTVQRIEKKAMGKLRGSPQSARLKEYYQPETEDLHISDERLEELVRQHLEEEQQPPLRRPLSRDFYESEGADDLMQEPPQGK